MKHLPGVLILLITSFLAVADGNRPALTAEHAWIREAPPATRMLAGYATLVNASDSRVLVTRVTSPDFAAVELHHTLIEDGIARMMPVGELEIPAHGRQVLEPGGMHLMLIDPHQPLRSGDSVTLDFQHGDGSSMRINAPVLRMPGAGGVHHHHH